MHSFDKTVDAVKVLNLTCTPEKRFDGLPDWEWEAEDMDGNAIPFQKYMPSCYDPTYCQEDPPWVPNADYVVPPKGTMKFQDGEQVIYICQNPGIYT